MVLLKNAFKIFFFATNFIFLIFLLDKTVGDLDISSFMPKSLKSFPNKMNVKSTTENLFKSNSENYIRKGPEFIRYQYLEKVNFLLLIVYRVLCSIYLCMMSKIIHLPKKMRENCLEGKGKIEYWTILLFLM